LLSLSLEAASSKTGDVTALNKILIKILPMQLAERTAMNAKDHNAILAAEEKRKAADVDGATGYYQPRWASIAEEEMAVRPGDAQR
jgi:hypothetical protein